MTPCSKPHHVQAAASRVNSRGVNDSARCLAQEASPRTELHLRVRPHQLVSRTTVDDGARYVRSTRECNLRPYSAPTSELGTQLHGDHRLTQRLDHRLTSRLDQGGGPRHAKDVAAHHCMPALHSCLRDVTWYLRDGQVNHRQTHPEIRLARCCANDPILDCYQKCGARRAPDRDVGAKNCLDTDRVGCFGMPALLDTDHDCTSGSFRGGRPNRVTDTQLGCVDRHDHRVAAYRWTAMWHGCPLDVTNYLSHGQVRCWRTHPQKYSVRWYDNDPTHGCYQESGARRARDGDVSADSGLDIDPCGCVDIPPLPGADRNDLSHSLNIVVPRRIADALPSVAPRTTVWRPSHGVVHVLSHQWCYSDAHSEGDGGMGTSRRVGWGGGTAA
jgi:hypothetical protein